MSLPLRVFVITSNNYLWCLSPFSYLFNKYWGEDQQVVVSGYKAPPFSLPNNFEFRSNGPDNAPQDRWSNTLMEFLNAMPDEYCVLMLEDYWITRPVDKGLVKIAYEYMQSNPDVLRFDLTGDVAHCNSDCRYAHKVGFIQHYDAVIKPPGTPYRMSFQAGIWNKSMLVSLLTKGKTPWQVEMYTEIPERLLVLGTLQWPLRYANAVYKGTLDMDEINNLQPQDLRIVERSLPEDMPRRQKDNGE